MGPVRKRIVLALALAMSGCTNINSKITGTPRAGAEQLLLTGTADRAIDCINFQPLTGAKVFLDTSMLAAPDAGWIQFSLRRAMARQGVLLVDTKADAQVLVEAALGAYGTDEVDFRLTTPGTLLAGTIPLAASIGDTQALIRKARQDAIVKLALTAYDTGSRQLVWESGNRLNTQTLDRKFIGTVEARRSNSLPELDRYPRRNGLESSQGLPLARTSILPRDAAAQ